MISCGAYAKPHFRLRSGPPYLFRLGQAKAVGSRANRHDRSAVDSVRAAEVPYSAGVSVSCNIYAYGQEES